ncbi:MAG TPA: hypothetical protein VLV15_07245, partial [Dongiaceae bacterium]|nr:hypothetical protein [Dongiaceae bacterium]
MSRRAGGEAGFLLVGVVMFVLALTILGISLYSLSSYEMSFQMQSRNSGAALYRAQGGLVMVQALLSMPPYRLSSASSAETHGGIVYALATQRRNDGSIDSLGSVNWGDTVTVTVIADDGDQSRTLRASYRPKPRVDPYTRLFTVSGNGFGVLDVPPSAGGLDRVGAYRIGDASSDGWFNSADTTAMVADLQWDHRSPFRLGNVSPPDVGSFYADHASAVDPGAWTPAGANFLMSLGQGAGTTSYYLSSAAGDYSFLGPASGSAYGTIRITGTVVWMFPRGFESNGLIWVRQGFGGGGGGTGDGPSA